MIVERNCFPPNRSDTQFIKLQLGNLGTEESIQVIEVLLCSLVPDPSDDLSLQLKDVDSRILLIWQHRVNRQLSLTGAEEGQNLALIKDTILKWKPRALIPRSGSPSKFT